MNPLGVPQCANDIVLPLGPAFRATDIVRIERIAVYQVDLPLIEPYYMSGGRAYHALDSTIVALTTDQGVVGWGESCPFGDVYLPAYAAGVRAGIDKLAPAILGESPVHLDRLNQTMDAALQGHLYVKAAIDNACWDVLGKVSGLSIAELLGGPYDGPVDLVSSVPTGTPDEMRKTVADYRSRHYRAHSFKLGSDPKINIERIRVIMDAADAEDEFFADANRGMTPGAALRVMRSVNDLDLIFEQPCATYEQCLSVRRRTTQLVMLDEIVEDSTFLLRVIADQGADMINIKIARVGGLTKARKIRDLCVAAGLIMTIQETGGCELARTATAHLAQSTPPQLCHSMWDCTELVSTVIADGESEVVDGRLSAPTAPGLGMEPRPGRLGDPVAIYEFGA